MVARHKPQGALRRQEYEVRPTALCVARDLVERYHYTHGGSNTGTYVHGLYRKGEPLLCLGVVWWLPPIKQAAVACSREEWRTVLQLSRTVLVPEAPKNAASFLIGRSIRLIRRDRRYHYLLSFADECTRTMKFVTAQFDAGAEIRLWC